ncbi:MAG: ABC transporter permease [Acidimicrobiales bacterium]
MKARLIQILLPIGVAVLLAMVIGALVLLLIGSNPIDAARAQLSYLDSADSVVAVLNRASWYYVSGLAAAIGFRMGLFNIGVDGQYRIAALLTAALGAELTLPAALHVPFMFIVAMIIGGAFAAIAGVLKVKRGVNEVISTIMLNYVVTGINAYLLINYFWQRDTTGRDLIPKTDLLPRSAWMPDLNALIAKFGLDLAPTVRVHGFLVVAALAGAVFYIGVWRTRFGFDLRMSGLNPLAARTSGVNPNAMIIRTMVISGALAGVLAMGPLLSEGHVYGDQFPTLLGFTGIAVALLGRNHPAGIAFGAITWAGLERGSQALSSEGIPTETSRILQGTLLLSAVITYELVNRRALAAATRRASELTANVLPASTAQVTG